MRIFCGKATPREEEVDVDDDVVVVEVDLVIAPLVFGTIAVDFVVDDDDVVEEGGRSDFRTYP
jgi:hypothetical protein